eukprot:Gb_29460 [translate_table: standard]
MESPKSTIERFEKTSPATTTFHGSYCEFFCEHVVILAHLKLPSSFEVSRSVNQLDFVTSGSRLTTSFSNTRSHYTQQGSSPTSLSAPTITRSDVSKGVPRILQ